MTTPDETSATEPNPPWFLDKNDFRHAYHTRSKFTYTSTPVKRDENSHRNKVPTHCGRTMECDMQHLPQYPLRTTSGIIESYCRHHIDYASHLIGRNATQEEAQVLAEHCERAMSFKFKAMLGSIPIGYCVNTVTHLFSHRHGFAKNNLVSGELLLTAARKASRNAMAKACSGLGWYAVVGWLLGDLISCYRLASAERQDTRLSVLRACAPRDVRHMAWVATDLGVYSEKPNTNSKYPDAKYPWRGKTVWTLRAPSLQATSGLISLHRNGIRAGEPSP